MLGASRVERVGDIKAPGYILYTSLRGSEHNVLTNLTLLNRFDEMASAHSERGLKLLARHRRQLGTYVALNL